MSSIAGRFGYPDHIAYATTKWGLVGFSTTLSLELGPHGITANTIHPGAVEGPRIERVMQGRAAVSGRTVEEETEVALTNQAIGRFVDPADIAVLAVFLAGPHGRSISGQAFRSTGTPRRPGETGRRRRGRRGPGPTPGSRPVGGIPSRAPLDGTLSRTRSRP